VLLLSPTFYSFLSGEANFMQWLVISLMSSSVRSMRSTKNKDQVSFVSFFLRSIGSSKSNYHTITTAPTVRIANLFSFLCCVYFCFVCLRSVCPMLPLSMDYPLLIVPLGFSSVYSLIRVAINKETTESMMPSGEVEVSPSNALRS